MAVSAIQEQRDSMYSPPDPLDALEHRAVVQADRPQDS